jgi:YD repeat-containing protein
MPDDDSVIGALEKIIFSSFLEETMNNAPNPYEQNLLALDLVIWQGEARVRRKWYLESDHIEILEHYRYDDTGRLLKTVEDDEWFQCTYAYDEAGRIIRRTHAPVDENDINPPTIDRYYYDDAGRITRKTVFYEEPDTESTFSFDDQGRIVAERCLHLCTEDGAITHYTFDYDEAGRLRTVEERFSRGSSGVSRYYYDDEGRLLLVHKKDSYDKITTTSYEYLAQTAEGETLINADFEQSRQLIQELGKS